MSKKALACGGNAPNTKPFFAMKILSLINIHAMGLNFFIAVPFSSDASPDDPFPRACSSETEGYPEQDSL
jgi:hypothetical protein